ncbi:hypothetical protein Ddye_008064 [Dipteronia dyeriana]|uniref:peptidylprolyl isomerase n=1 Tax=Dipteronia dyeriana TaxID=168575 RepID=A0AAD9X936_9ROSI|nr:hypothetical protein Ddye_008064 [Dipteronia dyeriana]
MDGSTSNVQVMKPVLLKACIPLVISLAGFVCAKIMARRTILIKDSKTSDSSEELRDEESYHSLNSTSSICEEEDGQIVTGAHFMNLITLSEYQEKLDYEQEISDLRRRVEELQKKEWETKLQFARYHDLKEQESLLAELKNMLLLESAYVEFLDREISSMEAENKRHINLVVEYVKILEQLQHWKSENGLLQRKVKKLLKRTKEHSRIIREKNSRLDTREAELLTNKDALEKKSNDIMKLEDEVGALQAVIDQLQEQKSELMNKLQLVEQYNSSKMEGYEQLQKDRAAEVKELIYLRWTNECLRHELMRNQAEKEQNQEEKDIVDFAFEGVGEIGECGIENHLDGLALEHDEPCSLNVENETTCSKKQKLLKKLRRWVDGSEKMKSCKFGEKEKHEIKCFGRHSVSDEAEEEHHIHARKSWKRSQSNRYSRALPCHCAALSSPVETAKPATLLTLQHQGRRALIGSLLTAVGAGTVVCDVAEAVSTSRRALRGSKIPETEYRTLPNGLKYYDLKVGNGLKAEKGSRVAVHYVAKWRGITFMTSRQGLGVGGGTPYGFDVGQSERGAVLKGLDLGVEGMRVGGQVRPLSGNT